MAWKTTITKLGLTLFQRAIAGGSIEYTKTMGSSTLSTLEDLADATDVSTPQYTLGILSVTSLTECERITVRAINTSVTESYILREIGVWAKIPGDGTDVLVAIAENPVGDEVPTSTDSPDWVCDYGIIIPVTSGVSPTVTVPIERYIESKNIGEYVSNPNLLDNPDFKINQRGKTTYNSYEYGVDRWYGNNSNASLTVTDYGVDLEICSGANWWQRLEKLPKGTYTFSAKLHETLSGSGIYLCTPVRFNSRYISGEDGVVSCTFVIGYDIKENARFGIYNGSTEVQHVKLEWMKLEIGNVATRFVPPNPVDELLKIQSMNDDGSPKIISSANLPTIMNSEMVSNPNILDNPDFKINQRGKTTYNATDYTVDRWECVMTKTTTISQVDNGIKIAFSSDASEDQVAAIVQHIEKPERFYGKPLTLTVNFDETTSKRIYLEIAYKSSANEHTNIAAQFIKDGAGVYSISGVVPNDVDMKMLVVRIYGGDRRIGDDVSAYSVISYAKLEIGSVATRFVPPNPASELAKCQRYYYPMMQREGFGKTTAATAGYIFLPVPTTMRDIPSIKIHQLGTIIANGTKANVLSVNSPGIKYDYGVQLQFTCDTNLTVDCVVVMTDTFLELDAEL